MPISLISVGSDTFGSMFAKTNQAIALLNSLTGNTTALNQIILTGPGIALNVANDIAVYGTVRVYGAVDATRVNVAANNLIVGNVSTLNIATANKLTVSGNANTTAINSSFVVITGPDISLAVSNSASIGNSLTVSINIAASNLVIGNTATLNIATANRLVISQAIDTSVANAVTLNISGSSILSGTLNVAGNVNLSSSSVLVGGNPVVNLGVAPKQYVDTANTYATGLATAANTLATTANTRAYLTVLKSGDQMSGTLNVTQGTASVNTNSGDLILKGGAGVGGNVYVGGAVIATGNVSGNDGRFSSFNAGPPGGERNVFINYDMRIDQRNQGANQTFTAGTQAYAVDRWIVYATGANVVGKRISGSGQSQYRYQITGATSVATVSMGQRVESIHSYPMNGGKATLSVDMSNSLLATVGWSAFYANTTDAFGTFAAPTKTLFASGTFNVTANIARYSATLDVPANAVNGIDIQFTVGAQISGTWVIGDAQLEPGSIATPVERRLWSTELTKCQRYYEKITYENSEIVGSTTVTTNHTPPIAQYLFTAWKTAKRSTPLLSFPSSGNWLVAGTVCNTVAFIGFMNGFSGQYNASAGSTAASWTCVYVQATGTGAFVAGDAEI